MIPKPVHKDVWTFDIEGKVFIEIVHWGVDRERPEFRALNDGKGTWNYYCIIPERIAKERFKEMWLEGKLERWSEAGQFHVSYDYMSQPFANVDWHGGITYYDRLGQIEGHRMVKMGCDFSHLFDQERGYPYDIESVATEAMETAKQLIALYNL